jgi:two-component system, OmpR family, sensor kinase
VAGVRNVGDRTPLRIKLVVAVLALVACALAAMGLATVTALREHLIGRTDDQLGGIADQARRQIAAGRTKLFVNLPQGSEDGVRVPDPYLLESLAADGSLVDSRPAPPPADAPDLAGADLFAPGPFTVASLNGPGRWRIVVVSAPQGQHVIVAARMADVDSTVDRLVWLAVLVGLAILAAVAIVGVWLVRASLRPLTEIELATAVVAAGDLSQRVPHQDARTEVGRLGQSFNVMIERIESAFAGQVASETAARSSEARALRSEERMRQFIADASHELRTPLTAIRGFAELYRLGAVQDPHAVAGLVKRIENDARWMGLLVEDLLLLARLDQQQPLAAEPVDLAVLAADAVDNAHVLTPDRLVSLDIGAGEPVLVTGDEHRLRQVIGNLLTNALTHTAADADVMVRLTRRADQAVIEVIDTGPGLTPEQVQRVFERFYRVDPARTRRPGGPTSTGLGLAIVAALVAAHAGTVEIDSVPGQGATFRMVLPLRSVIPKWAHHENDSVPQ